MADTRTTAQKNRAVRQEALREQLSKQKHLEKVVEIIEKLEDANRELDTQMVNRYKIAIDSRAKLINKYLPDLNKAEITGEEDGPLQVRIVRFADDQSSE